MFHVEHVLTFVIFYRRTDRTFSRRWRRNKDYTEKQLRWLARRRNCVLDKFKGGLRIKKGAQTIASFEIVPELETRENKQSSLYAALRR